MSLNCIYVLQLKHKVNIYGGHLTQSANMFHFGVDHPVLNVSHD